MKEGVTQIKRGRYVNTDERDYERDHQATLPQGRKAADGRKPRLASSDFRPQSAKWLRWHESTAIISAISNFHGISSWVWVSSAAVTAVAGITVQISCPTAPDRSAPTAASVFPIAQHVVVIGTRVG